MTVPRLFVAIGLPEPVKEQLLDLTQGALPGTRWSDFDQFHLTLRFIGDVHNGIAVEVVDILNRIDAAGFSLQLAGIHCFGNKRQARILWAGVNKAEELRPLQKKIERALIEIGLEPERRKYRPHVTLARCRGLSMAAAGDFLAGHADFRSDRFPVEHFALYSSLLGHGGAVYRVEASYPLA